LKALPGLGTLLAMATMITNECINCGACEPECPNTAIYQGGVEWDGLDGAKHPALVNEFFYIVPEKCTECVGFYDHEACAAVCPVDCCVPNPEIPETEAALLARAAQIHPDKSFGPESPSRFKAGAAEPAATAAPAAPAPAAAPAAAAAPAVVALAPEDELAAEVPALEDWGVPLHCFRCQGEFEVPFEYIKPGTVLHCPHCMGSFVPNTAMYQAIARRVARFYEAWSSSLEEFRERRQREFERFADGQRSAAATLRDEVKAITAKAELAGAPARHRGFLG
jgi:ferredoxin